MNEVAPGLRDEDFAEPRAIVHRATKATWDEFTLTYASLAACGWGGTDPDDLLSRGESLENHLFTDSNKNVTCCACKAAMVEFVLNIMPDF